MIFRLYFLYPNFYSDIGLVFESYKLDRLVNSKRRLSCELAIDNSGNIIQTQILEDDCENFTEDSGCIYVLAWCRYNFFSISA